MRIFITATNTNIGKTYTTLKLIEKLSEQGKKVGVFKPVETGVIDIPQDAKLLYEKAKIYNPKLNNLTIDDICPIQYKLPASPYVAKENTKIDFKLIKNSLKKIENLCDVVLIEGAGGLLVPCELDFYMYDFIEFLKIDKTILVTPSGLGSINDTLLSQQFLKSKGINFEWIVNIRDKKEYEKITLPFYRKSNLTPITSLDTLDI